jgi:hypothetical protein
LAIQHFEVSGRASLVAHIREADGFIQIGYLFLLVNSNLMEFLVGDQGIGYISEGVLNRLPVCDQSLLVL